MHFKEMQSLIQVSRAGEGCPGPAPGNSDLAILRT